MPTILTKRSNTPGAVPATANLTNAAGGAELAVNTADRRLFTINSSSAVVELGTNPSSLTCADASFTLMKAASATITNLTATSIVISNLSIASANITTLTSTNATAASLTVSTGNLTFSSTGQRITGDMSNATIANRLFFQNSVTNATTFVGLIPNGTGTTSSINCFGNSDPTNAPFIRLLQNSTNDSQIRSDITGTGTYVPMTFYTGGSERMRLDTSGNLGVGLTPTYKFEVFSSSDDVARFTVLNKTIDGTGNLQVFTSNNQAADFGGSISLGGKNGSGGVFDPWAFGVIKGAKENSTSSNFAGYLAFATANSGGTVSERLRIDSSGNVGIGTTSLGGFFGTVNLGGSGNPGSGFLEGWMNSQSIPSSVTTRFDGFISIATTAAASFTLTGLRHFTAQGATKGAGSTITSQFGFYVDNTLTGATNNFGFYSDIASGSNRWNFFANGTALNYFAGDTLIGTSTNVTGITTRFLTKASAAYAAAAVFESDGSAANWARTDWKNANIATPGIIYIDQGGEFAIRNDGNYPLSFYTNGANQRMTITGAGNVGIGTASPGFLFDTFNSSTATDYIAGRFYSNAAAAGESRTWLKVEKAANYGGAVGGYLSQGVGSGLIFGTQNNASTPTERMRIDSSGNVGIGGTADAYAKVHVLGTLPTSSQISIGFRQTGTVPSGTTSAAYGYNNNLLTQAASFTLSNYFHFFAYQNTIGAGSSITNQYGYFVDGTLTGATNNYGFYSDIASGSNRWNFYAAGTADNYFAGRVFFTSTNATPAQNNVEGMAWTTSKNLQVSCEGDPLYVNRKGSDGALVNFLQDGTAEGNISVAGNTVSYNPFMGSHYTEIVGAIPTLKGTVLESLDELVNGKYSSQDRLPKAKVSDTVGSSAVYGVYFAPDSDPDTNDGILAAALGASWVRIAAGVTVQRGDLLESNGDGCAKVQSDDIIRSKTIGKVTSTTVADTYADGSYIVPCVLYCG